MEVATRITIDEKVRFGKLVVKRTRMPVVLVLGKLARGMTYEEAMAEYKLTKEDILAVLSYVAKQLSESQARRLFTR